VLEDRDAVRMIEVFVQPDPMAGLPQDAAQGGLAHLNRFPPKVRAVQFQQVEGLEQGHGLVPAQDMEGHAPVVTEHHLPIY
jgi:hypothetical protein